MQLFRRNDCPVSSPVWKTMDLRLAGSQVCERLDQNLLRIVLLFLPLRPHFRSQLKYECDPEVTQVILGQSECAAMWGLTLKDRWHQESSLIPWAGQGSASDISVYGQTTKGFHCELLSDVCLKAS